MLVFVQSAESVAQCTSGEASIESTADRSCVDIVEMGGPKGWATPSFFLRVLDDNVTPNPEDGLSGARGLLHLISHGL